MGRTPRGDRTRRKIGFNQVALASSCPEFKPVFRVRVGEIGERLAKWLASSPPEMR